MNANAETEQIAIQAEMTMAQYMNTVIPALVKVGQDRAEMIIDSRINGLLGPVVLTLSLELHPVAQSPWFENNRERAIAADEASSLDTSEAEAVSPPRAQPFDPYSGR